jgi:hypothetical protein
MAKVFNPLSSIKASGKFQMGVFFAWRGLNVIREFIAPSQPRTVRQVKVRSYFTTISKYWANVLTEELRLAWAQMVFTWKDLWGNEVNLTGLNLFQKFNFILMDAGKPYQETPPPPVTPSEISITKEVGNEAVFQIDPITSAEVTAQGVFCDMWLAGGGEVKSITEQPDMTAVIINAPGMPQAVNPVKSDFRHMAYVNQLQQVTDPTKTKIINYTIEYTTGDVFTEKRKISAIFRRYNKHGNYSSPIKESDITIPA